jgi:nucleoside-diphosphate-sugar epimerase
MFVHFLEIRTQMSQATMTEPKSQRTRESKAGAILVTGAGGEMGHTLLAMLAAMYHGSREIVALDLRELPVESREHVSHGYSGDVSDAAFIESIAAKHEVGEIWHLAALLSTRGERSPELALKVNVMGSANLLKLAADTAERRGASVKFMFPSTIAVYGVPTLDAKRAAGRVTEDQCLEPITMYGVNKRAVEEMGRYYARHYRLLAADRMECPVDFRSIRFPGIISADTVPTGGTSDYGPEMLHAAAQGKPYACFVRPDARIPFMTMPDAVRSLMELAEAHREKLSRLVYNVAAFAPSAAEIADKVREFFPKAEITYAPTIERQKIVDSWPEDCDDSAARRDWGWKPEHDFHRAFAEYLVPKIKARYGR